MACLAVPSTHPPVSSHPSPRSGASSLVEDRPSGRDAVATHPAVPLRILMLAPEPFFEPRGTPFSEYHRIKALVEDGHAVDLVTYGYGADVDLPNLQIVRSARLPLVRRGADRAVADQAPARSPVGGDDAPAGQTRALRRHSFPRGSRSAGRVAVAAPGRAASLRHAFEPAAAALELPLHAIGTDPAGLRRHGAPHDRRLGRRDHDLPRAAGYGGRDGCGRSRRAHRERHGW